MGNSAAAVSRRMAGPGCPEPTPSAPMDITAVMITTSVGTYEPPTARQAATTAVPEIARGTAAPRAAASVTYSTNARPAATAASARVAAGGRNQTAPTTIVRRTSALRTRVIPRRPPGG